MTLNYQWRRLVSEALQYYFDWRIARLPDAEIDDTRNQFADLIHDLYTREPQTVIDRVEARRLANQSIAANTDTAIIFDAGDFDSINPTRLYFTVTGLAVISINFALSYANGAVPTVWFRFNGFNQTIVGKERSDANILQHWFNETWNAQVVAGQYVECFINSGVQPTTLDHSLITPRFAASIIGSE